uniref:Glycosyl transferase group 1 n=1 Tax=Cyanothece sp. (strain PCC 7425 / ATCC 29141) TaxID=395961 RepID=B8HQ75_CYAP4
MTVSLKHPQVGIYRRSYPLAAEPFITEQVNHLARYQPHFVLTKLLKQISFTHSSVSEQEWGGLKQLAHLLSRSPRLFPQTEALQKLALLHAHFGPDGVYALPLAEHLNIPLLVTFHGYDITLQPQSAWRSGRLFYYQLLLHQTQLQQRAAVFIAVSQFIRTRLLAQGYPAEKVIQHYIGVDIDKFTPAACKPQQRYILCVGRHTAKKGIDTLLRGFARIAPHYPEVVLLQVGNGPLTRKLVSLTQKLGLEGRVHWLGFQPQKTVLQLMQGAEIFALPSQTAADGDSEALGIVFNEASACGIPIVATRHGGIPEAVLDGETGFLVAERAEAELAEKLHLLLEDRSLGQQMGRRGREWVCDRFDLRRQTAQLETIYDSLI